MKEGSEGCPYFYAYVPPIASGVPGIIIGDRVTNEAEVYWLGKSPESAIRNLVEAVVSLPSLKDQVRKLKEEKDVLQGLLDESRSFVCEAGSPVGREKQPELFVICAENAFKKRWWWSQQGWVSDPHHPLIIKHEDTTLLFELASGCLKSSSGIYMKMVKLVDSCSQV